MDKSFNVEEGREKGEKDEKSQKYSSTSFRREYLA